MAHRFLKTSLLALAAFAALTADMMLAGPSAIGDSSEALEAIEAIPELPDDLSLLLAPSGAPIEAPSDLSMSVEKEGDI
ncbi:MAG: hypothetical protein HN348_03775 [Proteobacteria bacterium]|jgi:hypothetical protein|nr:hypothetical protein [Pseudomonadota bacterium]